MPDSFLNHISTTLGEIDAEGLYKREREITSAQAGTVEVQGREVVNLCANNYLGLANHPALIKAAQDAMEAHGFGLASVRFICGTQDIHRALETRLARFLGKDDAILFAACFDANGYAKAPPGLRIWCGATVEPDDVAKLTPWLDWTFAEELAAL